MSNKKEKSIAEVFAIIILTMVTECSVISLLQNI